MAVVDSTVADGLRIVQTEKPAIARPVRIVDALRVGEALVTNYGAVLRETIRVREQMTGTSIGQVTLRDGLRFIEQLYRAQPIALVDGIGLHETLLLQRAIAIIEKLNLGSTIIGAARYNVSLVQAIKLASTLARFLGANVTDALGINQTQFTRVLAFARATENIAIASPLTPQLLVSVKLADGVGIRADQILKMLFKPTLIEGVEFEAGYLAPDGSFTTWVMNTRTAAVTEYHDFVFNSFAPFGNRYLGASQDGLYELLGDTDNGASIVGRLKGGYLQFGGTQLSRLKEAYIAQDGQQRMVLRVITKDGAVYNYGVDTRDGRSTKVHMGKGQRSRYFAWELISVGPDFTLDTLEFVPIVVQRRV